MNRIFQTGPIHSKCCKLKLTLHLVFCSVPVVSGTCTHALLSAKAMSSVYNWEGSHVLVRLELHHIIIFILCASFKEILGNWTENTLTETLKFLGYWIWSNAMADTLELLFGDAPEME